MALRRKLAGWANLVLAGLLMFGVWGLVTVLSARPAFKMLWDLSPQARFSVSAATEELLGNLLEQGQRVEFYTLFEPLVGMPQNDEERQLRDIYQRLQNLTVDLLRQYEYLGGDAVLVQHLDLRRDLAKAREVLKGADRRQGNTVLVRMGERTKVLSLYWDLGEVDDPRSNPAQLPGTGNQLPVLRDYRGEEALSSAVQSLLLQGQPVVYFVTGHSPENLLGVTRGDGYTMLQQALGGDGFDIRTLSLETELRIPEDADLVAALEPRRELSQAAAEVLADHVRDGGRLFLNFSYYPAADSNPTWENLGRLLGFQLDRELLCQLLPDPYNPNSPGISGIHQVSYLRVDNLNPTHPITRPLRRDGRPAQIFAARELRRSPDAPEDLRVDDSLLRSSQWTWQELTGPTGEVDYVAPNSASAFRPRSVGMVIDVDAPDGGAGHAVLISGACFNNVPTGFPMNSDLALNIFNFLVERPTALTVRGRAYQAETLQLGPQQLGRISWLMVRGVPVALLVLGVLVYWRRSRA